MKLENNIHATCHRFPRNTVKLLSSLYHGTESGMAFGKKLEQVGLCF